MSFANSKKQPQEIATQLSTHFFDCILKLTSIDRIPEITYTISIVKSECKLATGGHKNGFGNFLNRIKAAE